MYNFISVKPGFHIGVTIAKHACYRVLKSLGFKVVSISIANISCEIWIIVIITTM